MKITAKKLTSFDLMQEAYCMACGCRRLAVSVASMYKSEHHAIETQVFWIDIEGIKTFVSMALCSATSGVTHYARHATDKTLFDQSLIFSNINHSMLATAGGLIALARKFLCSKQGPEIVTAAVEIKDAVRLVDPDLYDHMIPPCMYRGRCHDIKPCFLRA